MTTTTESTNIATNLLRAARELQRQATINAAVAAAGHAAAVVAFWHRGHWRYFLLAFGVIWTLSAIRRWQAFRELRDGNHPVATTMLSQPDAIHRIEGWPRGAKHPPFLTFVTKDGAALRLRLEDGSIVRALAAAREHFKNAVIDVPT